MGKLVTAMKAFHIQEEAFMNQLIGHYRSLTIDMFAKVVEKQGATVKKVAGVPDGMTLEQAIGDLSNFPPKVAFNITTCTQCEKFLTSFTKANDRYCKSRAVIQDLLNSNDETTLGMSFGLTVDALDGDGLNDARKRSFTLIAECTIVQALHVTVQKGESRKGKFQDCFNYIYDSKHPKVELSPEWHQLMLEQVPELMETVGPREQGPVLAAGEGGAGEAAAGEGGAGEAAAVEGGAGEAAEKAGEGGAGQAAAAASPSVVVAGAGAEAEASAPTPLFYQEVSAATPSTVAADAAQVMSVLEPPVPPVPSVVGGLPDLSPPKSWGHA